MGRPKRGEPGYEAATAKWRQSMARVAAESGVSVHDFMAECGRRGGKAHAKNAGFGSDKKGKDGLSGRERAVKMGRVSGIKSKRGKKYLYEREGYWYYMNLSSGELEKYPAKEI